MEPVDAEVEVEADGATDPVEVGVETDTVALDAEDDVTVVVEVTEALPASVMLGYPEYIYRAALSVKLGIRLFIEPFR